MSVINSNQRERFSLQLEVNEVLYVSFLVDSLEVDVVQDHYEQIQKIYQQHGLQFFSLQSIVDCSLSKEQILYYYPNQVESDFLRDWVLKTFEGTSVYNRLTKGVVIWKDDDGYYCRAVNNLEEIYKAADYIDRLSNQLALGASANSIEPTCPTDFSWRHHRKDDIFFSSITESDVEAEMKEQQILREGEGKNREYADVFFEKGTEELLEEVRVRINTLQARGIQKRVLEAMFAPPPVSSIRVTSRYRIYLPEYNNIEVEMGPLPKAVYILFLRHPEGIAFKDLWQYRDELNYIYMRISPRSDIAEIIKSVDRLVDSTNNSINEKCTRIKEAFLRLFDDSIACNYYITGAASTPKLIKINPSKIIFEE